MSVIVCPSRKVCYSRGDDRRALNDIRSRRTRKRSPTRHECKAYECRECGAWHLTSG